MEGARTEPSPDDILGGANVHSDLPFIQTASHLSDQLVLAKGNNGDNKLEKDVSNFFTINIQTFAVILGCAGAVIVLLGVVIFVILHRRHRRKHFDLGGDDIFNGCTKSEPSSRTQSPNMLKRLSCPDAFRHAKQSMYVRSVTTDKIPDFTLPPERIQPRHVTLERSNSVNVSRSHQPSVNGSLQPDLYSHSSSISEDEESYLPMSTYGRLWYTLVYDAVVEQLNVTLIKVKDLPGRGKYCYPRDPYVKIFLLPDDKTCRSSKVRKKTLSPIFNENFVFQVSEKDIKQRVLRFSVYDVDRRKVRHSLGHVMIPLKDVDLHHVDTYWADLEPMSQATAALGEIQLSMCYLPQSEKIKMTIISLRNLKQADMDAETGAFIRVQLCYGRKVNRTKRTSTHDVSMEMQVKESISFSISGKLLDSCRLEVALMLTSLRGGGILTHDVEYGRVVLGPFMYARGEELLHWQEMMAQPRVPVTRWHTLCTSTSHD